MARRAIRFLAFTQNIKPMIHRLVDLKKVGGASAVLARIPDFDLHRIKDLRHFEYSVSPESGVAELRISAVYRTPSQNHTIELLFSGVRELVVPTLVPEFAFKELEVEDVSKHGHEGVSFEVIDHYERDFMCRCGKLAVSLLE